MRRGWIILFTVLALIVAGLLFVLCFPDPDDQGFKDFCGEAKVIQSDFQEFYGHKDRYPEYTMEQLRQMGGRSDDDAEHEYWFYFTPFSSDTPDDRIVLRMGYGPLAIFPWLCDFSWTKSQLTHDPEPGPFQDRLDVWRRQKSVVS